MFQDPTFWVLVAFVGFIALIINFKVPGMVTSALDARAKKIKADLDEADSLLKEAQDLLALYQKKQRETEDEGEKIRAQAMAEADNILEIGRVRMNDLLERRETLATERIKQAETSALDEIRSQTVDIALEATRDLLSSKLSDATAEAMIENTIKDLPSKFSR